MTTENLNEGIKEVEVEKEKSSPLHKVTPLSKYLAMALFIVMPFIGGWIGYEYAPEKVVEVERVVVREEKNENTLDNTFKYLDIETGLPAHSQFTFDLYEDTSDWPLYENTEYGFSFKYPPGSRIKKLTQEDFDSQGWGEKEKGKEVFSLRDDSAYRHFIPTIWVDMNTEQIDTLEHLEKVVYKYSSNIYTTKVDDRPAFWECTSEGGGCSGYVVTKNYIFRIGGISNIMFNDNVVGPSESEVKWPERIAVPAS